MLLHAGLCRSPDFHLFLLEKYYIPSVTKMETKVASDELMFTAANTERMGKIYVEKKCDSWMMDLNANPVQTLL